MTRALKLARWLAAGTLAACALLGAGIAGDDPPRITVMTWNIYYGGGVDDGVPDMGGMWESVEATDFDQRAARLARTIDQQQPHIICLQEVARWQREEVIGGDDDTIDFLDILFNRLESRGLHYDLVGTLQAIDFEAPGIIDGDPWEVNWQERIVILARHSGNLQVNKVRQRNYTEFVTIAIPANEDLVFNRGWIAADITFKGRKARYVCTHLEALSGSVREDQATELIDWLSETNLPVIVMGDMNALPATDAYQQFIDAGYEDAWTDNHDLFEGPTCCQDSDLQNGASELARRIDHVFLRGSVSPVATARAGHKTSNKTGSGLWPSDHAAVVAKLQLE